MFLYSCCLNFSQEIRNRIENAFEAHGRRVGSRPKLVIALCLLVTFIMSFGLFRFHIEHRPMYLWLSEKSEFLKVSRNKSVSRQIPFSIIFLV